MKIICIGRNFSDHAKEMNAEQPSEPVFFIKPETAFTSQTELKIPEFTNNLNYELEHVFRISKTASNVVESDALAYFDAWTLGIDFTARDIQEELKAKRLPWEKAKAFDCSAFCAAFVNLSNQKLPENRFNLHLNKQLVQSGCISEMIFSPMQLLAYVSRFITLHKDDLLYTGTPAGVGPLKSGDILSGTYDFTQIFEIQMK